MFCATFGLNWLRCYGEDVENVKRLLTGRQTKRQTDGQNDTGQSDQKSSIEF